MFQTSDWIAINAWVIMGPCGVTLLDFAVEGIEICSLHLLLHPQFDHLPLSKVQVWAYTVESLTRSIAKTKLTSHSKTIVTSGWSRCICSCRELVLSWSSAAQVRQDVIIKHTANVSFANQVSSVCGHKQLTSNTPPIGKSVSSSSQQFWPPGALMFCFSKVSQHFGTRNHLVDAVD